MNLTSLFNRRKKQKKRKYRLEMSQKNHELRISGELTGNSYVKELWLFSREQREEYKVSAIPPSNTFDFIISLDDLYHKIGEDSATFDWYLKVMKPFIEKDEGHEMDDSIIRGEDGNLYTESFMRLGRFQYTQLNNLGFYYSETGSLINYVTLKGNISLVKNGEPNSPIKLQIDKLNRNNSVLYIEGKMFTRNSLIKEASLVLRGRDSGVELVSPNVKLHHLSEQVKEKYGLNRYEYVAEVDVSDINNGNLLEEDVYDFYLKLNLHDSHEAKYVRIGRPTLRARLFIKEVYGIREDKAIVVNPYYTFKKFNLSIEVYQFPISSFQYLLKAMRWSWLLRLLHSRKDIWIIGERTYKAQDTGLAFFKYMRENFPEKNVYYVIEEDSPERKNVEKFGNVLHFKSKEHILHAITAKKVISSHHPDYLYPIRTPKFKSKVKADKVFLQHGVMGTKNMVANYGKNAPGFDTDIFLVSSDFEKEMIVNDFGYSPKDVFVTGLSRFDSLFADDVQKKRQILIIPTWRDWIITDEIFLESEYFQRYKELIHSKRLTELSKKYDFQILFCLHPNMQKFSKYFEHPTIKVIHQGEVDVQHLIKESSLMITDYSSVGFDFSFLYKPVLYYQFDRSLFIGKRPSHLDLDNDLPGEIRFEKDDLLQLVEEYAKDNFNMKPAYKERADKFIKYRDRSSSERIYNVIQNYKSRKIIRNQNVTLLAKGLFTKFRKSKYYFPTMKLFYKIGSRIIPVDKNLILFESGLGKQYGDSPRNIYEEILRQGLDYKKVWVYNKNFRFNDPNTKKIKRLSPSYYYYLIRSGYWVNNQNFPTYIKKRPGTVFLQTWHGTPLKKMLYDLKEVHGRRAGYVDRVGNAVKNWDYLISPSPFATKAFRSAFRYDGKILEVGYPRNDIFFRDDIDLLKTKIRNRLNIADGKKIILYAPTFRDNQTSSKNKFLFELKMDLNQMKEKLGEEYIVLLRMHVVISNKINVDESLQDFVMNVSNYPDIQELLLLSDILITDYSSLMFDFANTGKPIIFFTYDFKDYRDNIRGFYLDFEKEAPGPLVYNTEEIIESVLTMDSVQEEFKEKYQAFQQKYCPLDDGLASKRIVDKVFHKDR